MTTPAPAQKTPRHGFCCPVALRRVRDADTVEVSIPGSPFVWAIRLLDVWAPELDGDARSIAQRGKAWLEDYLRAADPADLALFVPLPRGENLLKQLVTFDRLLGELWHGDTLVNRLIVVKGFASTQPGGELGE